VPTKISVVLVSIAQQRLCGFNNTHDLVFDTLVSTAANGIGQQFGSECTPLGQHRIRAKIGAGQATNTVFVGRRPTGEIYSEQLAEENTNRDWILTRILWLCGEQLGFNRGGQVDTQRRYIYIHGAPDSHPMGELSSHGCIKMRNSDIVTLFDQVDIGTSVIIQATGIDTKCLNLTTSNYE